MSKRTSNQSLTFLPRSLLQKNTARDVKVKKSASTEEAVVSDDKVKQTSREQRWPSHDEPVCVVCGKYGEYICDETDEDICSTQCKKTHLAEQQQEKVSESTDICVNETFDCYYDQQTKYIPHQALLNITEDKAAMFRKKMNIFVKGKNISKLATTFHHFNFPDQLLHNLTEIRYAVPSAVQMQVIPLVLESRDVLVSAATSSGKSAAFLLPIIHRIHACTGGLKVSHDFCKYPVALVLAPTRELCMQLEEQAKVFCRSLPNMKTALLVGGCPLVHQLHRLKHNVQLVIGTPGRINDILAHHNLNLHHVKMVVLDEVDVMLNMGFHSQILSILELLPTKAQHLFFSATIPPTIEALAGKLVHDVVHVRVGASGVPTAHVKQLVLWVEEASKKKKLFSILTDRKHFLPPAVVFVNSRMGADMLCEAVSKKFRLSCESIHSDKTQDMRTDILQQFLAGAHDLLVSTNVMGRGLDLVNVRQVILFDMPKSIDEYVHQVGRAGRYDEKGFSIAFINNTSKRLFVDLKNLFDFTSNKLPEELLHSPYLKDDGRKKKVVQSQRNEKEINTQNLFEILTKKR